MSRINGSGNTNRNNSDENSKNHVGHIDAYSLMGDNPDKEPDRKDSKLR
ncbi:hypothetical protein WD019_04755 [Fictibacillus sp. Mic-4]